MYELMNEGFMNEGRNSGKEEGREVRKEGRFS